MVVRTRRFRLILLATIGLSLCASGCVRREGRNSDCKWPPETVAVPLTARHLSEDAEFAEDLAIRYADVHHGLRTPYYVSGEDYVSNRDRCKAMLFGEIASEHSVPIERVYDALGQNRAYIDLAINLPFALISWLVVVAVARAVWRRYPPAEDGWLPGSMMILFLSVAFSIAFIMVGDVWARIAETYRVGNGHMSYRADRLIWVRHQTTLFSAALVTFLLTAAEAARRMLAKCSRPAG
jgi:hypothetical protein